MVGALMESLTRFGNIFSIGIGYKHKEEAWKILKYKAAGSKSGFQGGDSGKLDQVWYWNSIRKNPERS